MSDGDYLFTDLDLDTDADSDSGESGHGNYFAHLSPDDMVDGEGTVSGAGFYEGFSYLTDFEDDITYTVTDNGRFTLSGYDDGVTPWSDEGFIAWVYGSMIVSFWADTEYAEVGLSIAVLESSFDTISVDLQDDFNNGVLVSEILDGYAYDFDWDSIGIAVTGVDESNGVWQYSTSYGDSWEGFDSTILSEGGATLLINDVDNGDESTWVRFVPLAEASSGTTSITFHAWDGSDGILSGTTLSEMGILGGSSAFSEISDTAYLTLNPAEGYVPTGTSTNWLDGTDAADVLDVSLDDQGYNWEIYGGKSNDGSHWWRL